MCIDVLSKFRFYKPIKVKSAKTVCKAFENILHCASPRKPFRVHSDKGTEFINRVFQCMLKENDILFYTSESDQKCAVVEQWNCTIKSQMWKYF